MDEPFAVTRVRISTVSGRVTVTAEHRDDVVADRRASVAAVADGAIEVRAVKASDSVDVRCPAGADVIVGTRSGDVTLRGPFGEVSVTSQSGSIHVESAAEADLRTVSGTVELRTCEGRCRLVTTSGRVSVGATGDADISTTSGTIGVDEAMGAVQVRVVSGSVKIASAARGRVTVSTVSGSITIRLPEGVRPAVHTSGQGKVRNSFEAGDDVVVDVANVSGTIRLVPA